MSRVIAEIGCNHKGSVDIAKEMISVASLHCNVDVVKFQKRTIRDLLTEKEYSMPHPVPHNSYGKTYGSHRDFLELSLDEHKELKDFCETLGVEYSSSVWDINAAKDICSLNPGLIKIPSACNLKFDILQYLLESFDGEIHVSLGMTTRSEEARIIRFFEKFGRLNSLVLYACTSGYPVPFEDVCLLEIDRIKSDWRGMVTNVGFSGHHLGIAVDMGAITLGASHIERHFTLDRTWKGTDHAASLEPDGMRKLVRDVSALKMALSQKNKPILDIEMEQRNKFNKKGFYE